MRRFAIFFGAGLLLWTITGQLNHALAPSHVALFTGGLMIAYAALVLPLAAGIACSATIGLVCDAGSPMAFGTLAFLFACAHLALFRMRGRLPKDDVAGRVGIAAVANLALFLAVSLLRAGRMPSVLRVWPRLGADLIWSQLFVAAAATWFFALQERALILARVEDERL